MRPAINRAPPSTLCFGQQGAEDSPTARFRSKSACACVCKSKRAKPCSTRGIEQEGGERSQRLFPRPLRDGHDEERGGGQTALFALLSQLRDHTIWYTAAAEAHNLLLRRSVVFISTSVLLSVPPSVPLPPLPCVLPHLIGRLNTSGTAL